MPDGQLGRVDPAAATETALYAPPPTTVTSLFVIVTNRNLGTNAKVRVVHRPGAAATVPEDHLAFDEAIPANESRASRVFDVLNPQEVLVQSDVTGVTFQANGIERTP